MSFFRHQVHIFTSLGTGIFIGIVYWRMTNRIVFEIQKLTGTIAQLKAEVHLLKDKLQTYETKLKRRKTGSGFFSLQTSTGEDDDDIYEEAYGGESDLEYQKEIEDQIIPDQTDSAQSSKQTQSTDGIFPEIDRLLEGTDSDKEQAYYMLQKNKENYSTDVEFFWRFAKSTFNMSQIEEGRGDASKRKSLIFDAKELAFTAVTLDETCANAHKWFAITVGSLGEFETTQDKIKNGFLYKEHIEKAIKLKPDDSSNHYLLGRWCYSVYMLSWIERKAAAALFATPPTATIDESLEHFLKADELNPGKWKGNILFIAKCYIEMSRYKEAKKWLESGRQIPIISQDDKTSEEEIQALLTKYKSY